MVLTHRRWSGTGISEVGYDVATSKVRVRVNPQFYRPLDNNNLLGSPAKAEQVLGWQQKYDFKSLVEEMVLSDIEATKNGSIFAHTNLDWFWAPTHDSKAAIGGYDDAVDQINAPINAASTNGYELGLEPSAATESYLAEATATEGIKV